MYSKKLMDIITRLLTKSAVKRPTTLELLQDPYVKNFPLQEVPQECELSLQEMSPQKESPAKISKTLHSIAPVKPANVPLPTDFIGKSNGYNTVYSIFDDSFNYIIITLNYITPKKLYNT